ncbi:hypothetical protein [Serratia fonticola]|uniref:hypothetical protein n=1 Tax=Serratia fonticola TaxID=47917 RepID=UPI001377E8F3|nr:hypothetical protein [Serratia fonticola]NCG50491.1 hypothetical protein [Serratia fonticola]
MLITLIAAQAKKLENGGYRSFGGSRGAFWNAMNFFAEDNRAGSGRFSPECAGSSASNAPKQEMQFPGHHALRNKKGGLLLLC